MVYHTPDNIAQIPASHKRGLNSGTSGTGVRLRGPTHRTQRVLSARRPGKWTGRPPAAASAQVRPTVANTRDAKVSDTHSMKLRR
jgi:hypothetical protein